LRFADVSQVADGAIICNHTHYHQLAMLTQLGLMDA
jgi:hypothetical protein